MIIDKEEKWVFNIWIIKRMTPVGREVIAHHCRIVYFSCYFSCLEDSSGLSQVLQCTVSQDNRLSCQPQRPGTLKDLPPDRGESAVSTHASLAEWGILDFLDALCHRLGESQVSLMISILK